jgi:glutamate-ammonia-ligase adenylyltransferase
VGTLCLDQGAADDGQPHDELEAIRRPFVFRKYLDFGAINAMRELHAQIRQEVAKKDKADNVKLGPGGIREIEFIAQVFQLIRGGRDPALQIKPTLQVLKLLASNGPCRRGGGRVSAAYDFLRRVEHRLQYLDDAQTHMLPTSDADRAIVARAMGYGSFRRPAGRTGRPPRRRGAPFRGRVRRSQSRRAQAGRHVARRRQRGPGRGVRQARLPAAAEAAQRVAALREGPRYQQLAASIRERFDALVPQLIQAAAEMPNPDATLSRSLDLLESISRRAAYLALLQQYPQALRKVAELVSSSSWAADYLQRHPILLDELLDPRLLDVLPDWSGVRTALEARLAELEPDTERQMDLLRETHHAQVFRLLAQDVAGLYTVERWPTTFPSWPTSCSTRPCATPG